MTTNGSASASLARIDQASIQPSTLGELRTLAKSAAGSRFFGAKTEDECLMVMLVGRDLGFSFAQSLRAFDVIKGKPSLKADGMVAVALSRPDICEYFYPVEQTPTKCTWTAKRVGHKNALTQSFTIEEAKAAGLLDQNSDMYRKWPTRMLSARVKSFIFRDLFPELGLGLLSTEEAEDIAAERNAMGAPPGTRADAVPDAEYEEAPAPADRELPPHLPSAPAAIDPQAAELAALKSRLAEAADGAALAGVVSDAKSLLHGRALDVDFRAAYQARYVELGLKQAAS